MTSRRGFLGGLAAFAAACALDPDRALWVPGAKTISIPAVAAVLEPLEFWYRTNEPGDDYRGPVGFKGYHWSQTDYFATASFKRANASQKADVERAGLIVPIELKLGSPLLLGEAHRIPKTALMLRA